MPRHEETYFEPNDGWTQESITFISIWASDSDDDCTVDRDQLAQEIAR